MDSILFLPIFFVVSYNFAIFAIESAHIEHDVIDERQQEAMTDKNMEWKTLSQKYLIKRPWLTARVDQVELPTGAIIDEYYVLEYPDWVNTIAITKEGKFVFVRQYRYAIGKTVNELCAGVIEKGEDVEVRIFTREEVLGMLQRGEVWQSLMAAPFWKYFATR